MALNDAGGAAYCGINAAAVAVWLGETEAALILGNEVEADAFYRQASETGEAGKRWADIASTRKQCRELCLKLHSRRSGRRILPGTGGRCCHCRGYHRGRKGSLRVVAR